MSVLDRRAILIEATRILTAECGFNCAWFAERDDDETVVIRYGAHMLSRIAEMQLKRGRGLGGKVFALGRTLCVDEYLGSRAITHHYDEKIVEERMHGIIGTPIRYDGTFEGVLMGGSRDGTTFGDGAAKMIETVAERTAQALNVAEQAQRRSAAAIQEERQRMALDLHDTVGAMLFAITAGVRSVNETVSDGDLRARLGAIESQAKEAATMLRDSLRALATPTDQLALGSVLQAAIHHFEVRSSIKANLVMLDVLPSLSDAAVRILIAAAKEGLLNIEKHARASSVVVTLGSLGNGVTMAITDDGIGASGEAVRADERDHGFGLDAIEHALAGIGGTLHVSENPEGGTTFRVWVRS
ncbi:MAG TPA: histidine kinase [Candidatus Baltobacteraceae bacterium]|nr:histidine kinase [Candidatus Baltobacteraceae bacterium]